MVTICKAIPKLVIINSDNVAFGSRCFVCEGTSSLFSSISLMKGFVHLGRYATKI